MLMPVTRLGSGNAALDLWPIPLEQWLWDQGLLSSAFSRNCRSGFTGGQEMRHASSAHRIYVAVDRLRAP